MELEFPVILDGAMGTQLQKEGFSGGECAEKWALENPQAVIKIQKKYVDAGAQILYAPTFGANRIKLEEHGIFGKVVEYNTRLVELTKQAAHGKAFVAGDIAPTGKLLYPLGDITFDELYCVYKEAAQAQEDAGVDLFCIETMMTVAEARAALLAVRSVSDKPVFVSFTCDENGKTLSGTDVTAALVIMQGMGADVFGLNCSTGPESMLCQLKRLHKYARIPLMAKPNAGMPVFENGKAIYNCPAEYFASFVPEMAAAGVALFGGCCGSDESHIFALKEAVKNIKPAPPKPAYPDLLPCATEKEPVYLPADSACDNIIVCDEFFEENLQRESENDSAITAILIDSTFAVQQLADFQYAIQKPLCVICNDTELLEKALSVYQGRALYQGGLTEDVLKPLSKRYGLIY